ncbi:gallidermin family lantibiotic [Vibrio harveyi]
MDTARSINTVLSSDSSSATRICLYFITTPSCAIHYQ